MGELADARRRLAAELHARGAAARRRRPDAARQPAGVGADDARVLPPGLRRAARAPSSCGRTTSACGSSRPARRSSSCDERNAAVLARRRLERPDALVALGRSAGARSAAAGRARARRPVPDHVHLRHRRRAEGCTSRSALPRRPALQAERWLDARPGELVWCTAASGWSKSARNAFIAPWLRGAAALLHDARFDPHERLELLERERVAVLCMAPTEYRVIAKRAAPRPRPRPARARRRRRGARPRRARRLARRDRPVDPRRLRPDRDRPAHRHAARRARAAGLDGHAAARASGSTSSTASSCSTRRPTRRSSCVTSARSRPPARGGPATACAPTRTASSTSRAAPTT